LRQFKILVIASVAIGVSGCSNVMTPSTQQVACRFDPGGQRSIRPCEAQFQASALDVKLKATVLQQYGAELGISRQKLIDVADKTLNTVAWLRDLCADWNACAVTVEAYNERKTKLVAIEDNFYALASRAEALSKAATKKSLDDPDVRELANRIDVQMAEADKLAVRR